jgi:SM-20-related protein
MSDLLEKSLIDLDRFAREPLTREPFEFLVVPEFLPQPAAEAVATSFPGPDMGGVLPVPNASADTAFGRLLTELRSPAVSHAFGEKFGLHLDPDSLMITMRARTRPIDGQIHTDSETKVVTALIYLNTGWDSGGGRLRLLRGPNDLDDMIAEVPPMAGTLLAFRRSDNSWHGHKPFDGVRRSIMLNWMIDPATARWEERRHGLSAGFKRLFGGAGR